VSPPTWFVEVVLLYIKAAPTNQFAGHTDGQQTLHERNGSIKTTAQETPDDGPMKARNM
jgi:hypothetical protein